MSWNWLLVPAVFVAGMAQGPLYAVGPRLQFVPGDRIDGRFNLYVLEHGYRWLRGDTPRFWDMPVYYPARRVTAYSDAHLGSLPVYAGLRAAGLTAEHAYQGWFLLWFPLNFAAAGWAARRCGGGPVAVAACGFVYAFAAVAVVHSVGHSQLGPRWLVPPAVVFALEWLATPTTRKLAAAAACLVGQAYLTLYIAYYLGLLVLATAAAAAVFAPRSIDWPAIRAGWRRWLLVAAVTAAVLTPLVRPYAKASADHPISPVEWLKLFTPTPWAWLLAPSVGVSSLTVNAALPPPAHPGLFEMQLFPGWLSLAGVLACGLAARRRPTPVNVLAAAALGVVVFTTRVGGVCLYDPVFHLPGVGGIRVVARVVLVLLFPAGLAIGVVIESLPGRWWKRGMVLAVVVADQAILPPGHTGWPGLRTRVAGLNDPIDRLADAIRTRRPEARVLYVFPAADDKAELPGDGVRQLQVMFAAQRLGVPTVNGYSGYWPHRWELFRDYDALLHWLPKDKHAGLVVVGEPTRDSPANAAGRATYPPLDWPDR
jgi:hypothetical protein